MSRAKAFLWLLALDGVFATIVCCGSGFKASGLGVSVEGEGPPATSSSVVTSRDSHAVQTGRSSTTIVNHYHGCPECPCAADAGTDAARVEASMDAP